MKKQVLIFTAALIILASAGCAQNGGAGASATTTAAAATTAAAETTTTTAAATEAATTTTAKPVPTLPDERLFGGYVASDDAAEILDAPDGEKIAEIPGSTQIDVYYDGTDGWFMTEFDGKIGYIKAEKVAEIPAYDMDDIESYGFTEVTEPPISGVSIKSLEGDWLNVNSSTDILTITSEGDDIYNGTFRYGDGSETAYITGYIKLCYLLNPDDSKTFWYVFCADDGALWYAFSASGDLPLNNIFSGQDGAQHFMRDGSDGFWQDREHRPSSISVAGLMGTWTGDGDTLVVENQGDIYNGTFTYTSPAGEIIDGYIKLCYTLNPDDSRSYWYAFWQNDGTFWNAFTASGEIPLTDIYAGQSGEPHFSYNDWNSSPAESTGSDWRTWRSYSDDIVLASDLTVCLALLDDGSGYAVYNSADGSRIGSLIDESGTGLIEWNTAYGDLNGDGINEIKIVLSNKEELWFTYNGRQWSEENPAGCFERIS